MTQIRVIKNDSFDWKYGGQNSYIADVPAEFIALLEKYGAGSTNLTPPPGYSSHIISAKQTTQWLDSLSTDDVPFMSINDPRLPSPAKFGTGPFWIDGVQYWSDGVSFIAINEQTTNLSKSLRIASNDPLSSTIYSATKTATNSATNQFEAFADGAIGLIITNNSAVNCSVMLGSTSSDAIANTTTTAVNAGQTVNIIRKATDKYYAWKSLGATVQLSISQGA